MNKMIDYNNSIFEDIKHIDEDGNEYWYAKDLMSALGYTNWTEFKRVIKKATTACANSDIAVYDNFYSVYGDYKLSRLACYLIVINANPKYEAVALCKTYFAIQTRKRELLEENYNEVAKRAFIMSQAESIIKRDKIENKEEQLSIIDNITNEINKRFI